jgi:hypothetical protein
VRSSDFDVHIPFPVDNMVGADWDRPHFGFAPQIPNEGRIDRLTSVHFSMGGWQSRKRVIHGAKQMRNVGVLGDGSSTDRCGQHSVVCQWAWCNPDAPTRAWRDRHARLSDRCLDSSLLVRAR